MCLSLTGFQKPFLWIRLIALLINKGLWSISRIAESCLGNESYHSLLFLQNLQYVIYTSFPAIFSSLHVSTKKKNPSKKTRYGSRVPFFLRTKKISNPIDSTSFLPHEGHRPNNLLFPNILELSFSSYPFSSLNGFLTHSDWCYRRCCKT